MGDFAVILSLLRGQARGGPLAARLERFYAPQAERYDAYHKRLLHGRRAMLAALELQPGQHVVELGGGTGRNLDYYAGLLPALAQVDVVDICRPLLAQAAARTRGRENVRLVLADAADYDPGRPVDRVYFSYALTMMPRWQAALANAWRMLKPGGLLGVVDFYLFRAQVAAGEVRHNALLRLFWRHWFAHDGVFLDATHLEHLEAHGQRLLRIESAGAVPYLPFLRAPYYLFVGRKPDRTDSPT